MTICIEDINAQVAKLSRHIELKFLSKKWTESKIIELFFYLILSLQSMMKIRLKKKTRDSYLSVLAIVVVRNISSWSNDNAQYTSLAPGDPWLLL